MTNYLVFVKRLLLGLAMVAIAFIATGCVSRAPVAALAPIKTVTGPSGNDKQALQVVAYPGKVARVILPYNQLFAPGKSVLKPRAYALLGKAYKLTQSFSYPKITVVTDHAPSSLAESARHALAMKRANSIAAYFWAQGIPRDHIVIIDGAAGLTQPMNPHGIVPILSLRNIELQFREG